MRFLRRLRRAFRRCRGAFPLTATGVLIACAAGVGVLHYGLGKLDLVLLALGSVALLAVAACTVLVALGALLLWLRARKVAPAEPLRLECGYSSPTGFELPSLRFLPLVEVSWTWSAPGPEVSLTRSRGALAESVRPTRRDHFTEIVRRIEVRDAFGFAAISFLSRQERAGHFAPSVGGLEQMHVVRGLAGGADLTHPEGPPRGDYYDMRRYEPGDPIRFVLWKVFAKTRQLLVRGPENALSEERRTVAYLVAGDEDEAAAGAARVAVDGGALGSAWVLGADGCADLASTSDEAIEILARSARAENTGALAAFLARIDRGRTPTRAVVFVPPRPGPWMQRVIAASRADAGHRPPFDFVVCTDGVRRARKRPLWARAAIDAGTDVDPGANAEELAEVVAALGATGARVLVVDRPGGRVFSSHELRARA